MKTLLTTLALITVSLVATETASAQVVDDDGNVTVGDDFIGGLWLPAEDNWLEVMLIEQTISQAEYELTLLYWSLEELEAELASLLNQAPSSRNFKSYSDYQYAYKKWRNEVNQLMREIRYVEYQIEDWESTLEYWESTLEYWESTI